MKYLIIILIALSSCASVATKRDYPATKYHKDGLLNTKVVGGYNWLGDYRSYHVKKSKQ